MKKNLPVLFAADVINFVPSEDNSKPKKNIAYSGGIVNTLDDLGEPVRIIIDLSTVQLNQPSGEKYPMVFSHDNTDWIGSFRLAIDNNSLDMYDIQMLDNKKADMVVDASKKGFPVKASIRVESPLIEYVNPHETQTINGREVSDVHIFKNSIIKEVSATAFPVDKDTSLNLFSNDFQNNQFIPITVREKMTEKIQPTEIELQLAEAQKQIVAQSKLLGITTAKLSETEAQNTQLQSENAKLAEENGDIALELRMKEITSIEGCLGEFPEDARGKLQGLDAESFDIFKEILTWICETKMVANEPDDTVEPSEGAVGEMQMSEPYPLHSALFADTAKVKAGTKRDDFDEWLNNRNPVRIAK